MTNGMKGKTSAVSLAEVMYAASEMQKQMTSGGFRLFFVDEKIHKFSFEMAQAEVDSVSDEDFPNFEFTIPSDAIRHGDLTILAVPNKSGLYNIVSFTKSEDDADGNSASVVGIVCDAADKRTNVVIGIIFPGKNMLISKEQAENSDPLNIACMIATSAFTLSLINQPRMVSQSPAASRQVSRSYQRAGVSTAGWSKVTWDISRRSAEAHTKESGGVEGKALHWRRGHWRRAQENWKGAVQRPDALRPEERDLWWQWIEGMWVGHPAYGFVQSVHAPKMSTTEMFKRGSK